MTEFFSEICKAVGLVDWLEEVVVLSHFRTKARTVLLHPDGSYEIFRFPALDIRLVRSGPMKVCEYKQAPEGVFIEVRAFYIILDRRGQITTINSDAFGYSKSPDLDFRNFKPHLTTNL